MAKKLRSIRYKVVFTFWIVVIAQMVVIGAALIISGVIPNLRSNAYEIFSQTVTNRRNYIESEMHNRWSVIDSFLPKLVSVFSQHGEKAADLDDKEIIGLLESAIPVLVPMLRDTGATGSFIILNDNEPGSDVHSCLYFKDYDPNLNDLQNNSDLLILKGPLEFVEKYKIPLDGAWNYAITLTENNRDLFYKPYEAAKKIKDLSLLGYWHISRSLYDENIQVATYTKPLVGPDGEVFGVAGVEISQDYFYRLLPDHELADNSFTGYALVSPDEQGVFFPVMVQGALLRRVLPYGSPIKMKLKNAAYDGYSLPAIAGISLAANFQQISLYNRNTPFTVNPLYLIGITDLDTLVKSSADLSRTLVIIILFSLIFGVVMASILGLSFTGPIVNLAMRIRGIKPGQAVSLEQTGISEIDDISTAIEQLNDSILNSLLKTDKIINMVNLDIGSFEHKAGSEYVRVSEMLAEMLEMPTVSENELLIPAEDFKRTLDDIKTRKTGENIFQYSQKPPKWFKIESIATSDGEFGIVIDVTADELSKQMLMFERDYDSLTRIYNRYAFQRELEKLCREGNLKNAVFLMSDLDNLKYVNDTYGHDIGDLYIKTTATMLADYLRDKRAIVGRMSGDEFYSFIYGYESEDEARAVIEGFYVILSREYILLPDGGKFKLKMSSGLAWYGKDSTDPSELIRFADFAMYQVKKTVKGGIREFDKSGYLAGSYMVMGKEELYSIFDEQLIEYVFQPIINVNDGSIYGYEALMRPQGKTINTPDKLIMLAAAQGQLWRVEKITFFMVFELYKKYRDLFGESRVFINSVPNQALKDSEYEEIETLYHDFLHRIVLEITESENINNTNLKKKKELVARWNALLALDDYGSGYANDLSLVNMHPNIIKIDRFLVDGIESSLDKQAICTKTVAFAKERGIVVLAEGVETAAQLKTVVELGIELVQGYYICRPLSLPDFSTYLIRQELASLRS